MIEPSVAWNRVVEKAEAHKAAFPKFALERYLARVKSRGESYIRYASGRSTATINKSRRKDDSLARWAASSD